jgi:hypothetical protein
VSRHRLAVQAVIGNPVRVRGIRADFADLGLRGFDPSALRELLCGGRGRLGDPIVLAVPGDCTNSSTLAQHSRNPVAA